jgi:hypothetical protein
MKEQSSYSGLDFDTIWFAPFDNYPILQWHLVWISVPDVIGSSQTVAESALTAAGLTTGNITYQVNESIPEGMVINQSPSSLTTLPQGSQVNLIVSKGPAKPDITGEGVVNLPDFSVLSNKWSLTNCIDLNEWCEGADINYSGSVDIDDLRIMAEHWLEGTTL